MSFLLLFACSNRPVQDLDCKQLSIRANKYFEFYLYNRNLSDLELSNYYVRKSLECDPAKPFNNWLRIKIFSAKKDYDSTLIAVKQFEKFYNGPDLIALKGEVYDILGLPDSSRSNFEKAAILYDTMLKMDSSNSTLILARLKITLRLEGKEKAYKNLKHLKDRHPNLVELESAERILFDSIYTRDSL